MTDEDLDVVRNQVQWYRDEIAKIIKAKGNHPEYLRQAYEDARRTVEREEAKRKIGQQQRRLW